LTENPDSFLERQHRLKGKGRYGSIPLAVAVKIVPAGAIPVGSFGASGAYSIEGSAGASGETMQKRSIVQQSRSGNGHLNPEFVEWLMGFEIGHTDCDA
jgi:hypothetical protein